MFRLLKELEVWDVVTNQMDVTLDQSEIKSRGFLTGEYDSSFEVGAGDSILASAYHDPCFLFIRSLETGRSLQNYSLPFQWVQPVRFSPDGRFLIVRYPLKHPLVRMAQGLHKGTEKWLQARFPVQQRLALMDVHSGEIWPGLMGNGLCAFTDEGARLISFTNEGGYEWDVPPRWQYFTPWAWAALGASAGLRLFVGSSGTTACLTQAVDATAAPNARGLGYNLGPPPVNESRTRGVADVSDSRRPP